MQGLWSLTCTTLCRETGYVRASCCPTCRTVHIVWGPAVDGLVDYAIELFPDPPFLLHFPPDRCGTPRVVLRCLKVHTMRNGKVLVPLDASPVGAVCKEIRFLSLPNEGQNDVSAATSVISVIPHV